jgi:hypothetical protein
MFAEIASASGSVAIVAKLGVRSVLDDGRSGSSQAARATVRPSAMTLRMDGAPLKAGSQRWQEGCQQT